MISIITSTYNCELDISITIDSISQLKMDNPNIQWIVIDGGSTDNTVQLIRESKIHSVLISEPDRGIYDAWNKAVTYISNDWVIFMGAGDTFSFPDILIFFESLALIDSCKYKVVFGNVHLVDENLNVLKKYGDIIENDWSCGRPSLPCHQGVFQHHSLFNGKETFDCSYKIAADSKFILESFSSSNYKHIDLDIARMQIMGVSTNPNKIIDVVDELSRLRSELGLKMPFYQKVVFYTKSYMKHFFLKLFPFSLYRKINKIICIALNKEVLY